MGSGRFSLCPSLLSLILFCSSCGWMLLNQLRILARYCWTDYKFSLFWSLRSSTCRHYLCFNKSIERSSVWILELVIFFDKTHATLRAHRSWSESPHVISPRFLARKDFALEAHTFEYCSARNSFWINSQGPKIRIRIIRIFENTGKILNLRTNNSSTGIVLECLADFLVWDVFHRKKPLSSLFISIPRLSSSSLDLLIFSSLLFHLLSSFNTQKRDKPDKWLHQRRTAMHHERESCHIVNPYQRKVSGINLGVNCWRL